MVGYRNLKRILYALMTAGGVFLLVLANRLGFLPDPAHASQNIACAVMAVMGSGLLIFGIVTFIIRSDEDVWR